MLSILIPIYNFDVSKLVQQLHQQGLQLSIPFEIQLLDDASTLSIPQNAQLAELPHVYYTPLPQNVGRAKIRNLLAQEANYPYLLFMDGDSMPISEKYLANYVKRLHPTKLLYGGRVYQTYRPKADSLLLHWKYGTHREAKDAQIRCQAPYQSFMTNNFLIPKQLFMPIGFDESILQYGHEDTLFGIQLEKANIAIQHIDNPLMHIGLENNQVFINKTQKAIENLYKLDLKHAFEKKIKLLNYYKLVKRFKMTTFAMKLNKKLQKPILKNLKSSNPNLRLFDLYKLFYLIEVNKNNQKK